MSEVRRNLLLAGFVGVAVFAVYANGLGGSFQFDDWNVIVGEPTVHSLAAWVADLGHGIRPVLKLSYALNWILDPGPFGYRLVNLGIHIVNTLLVYALARVLAGRMLPVAGGGRETGATASALATALLFGLHPVQTEAVTYISGRSTALMATFYLAGVLAYVVGEEPGRRVLRWVAAPLLFVLAMATKEVAVTFPLALLLCDLTKPGPLCWRVIARRLLPYVLLVLGAGAALMLHPIYGPRLGAAWQGATWTATLPAQVEGIAYLVAQTAWPHPLNIDPDLRAVTWSPWLVVQAVLLTVALGLGLATVRRVPWLGFGILWFALQLLPTNSLLLRADVANERSLYLAGFGPFFAVGVAWSRVLRWSRELTCSRARRGGARRAGLTGSGVIGLTGGGVIGLTGGGVMVLLAVLTTLRNADYATEVRLWTQTARVSPGKPRVFNNLGYAYQLAGCPADARRAYELALALDPDYRLARENLAGLARENLAARASGQGGGRCPEATTMPHFDHPPRGDLQ